jgi:glycosyltransferase involved in cell wall biosynthesis
MIGIEKPRLLIFIVAYNAEKTITSVVHRIPASLSRSYDVEVLIIDDASADATFAEGHHVSKAPGIPFPVRVLFNPVNQGYGGNQKLGYRYAIANGFDFVALVHGDGQYAPEGLHTLLEPLRKAEASAVFGSRMLDPMGALKGGMPLYKFAGNRILTWIENKLLRSRLSEFHSGYRIYSVRALEAIPFERNSNNFHFDTEIIIQLLIARRKIVELPIPTHYGEEICHVNGLKYARNVIAAALKARLQEWSLFYDRRFDCAPPDASAPHMLKLGYLSPHTLAVERVRPGSRVLDLGAETNSVGPLLARAKRCAVTAVPLAVGEQAFSVPGRAASVEPGEYDAVLLLDVLEHLPRPESFLEELRRILALSASPTLIVSTANVGFFITRAMLLLGQFNYSKHGILDVWHTRLFTFASLRRALDQAGFNVLETEGIPAPYPLALGDNALGRTLLAANRFLIKLSRGLFSYQILMTAKAKPTVESLLNAAREQSHIRTEVIEAVGADDAVAFQLALERAAVAAPLDRGRKAALMAT